VVELFAKGWVSVNVNQLRRNAMAMQDFLSVIA